MNLHLFFGFIIVLLNNIRGLCATTNHTDDIKCNLDPNLVKEISSYKNIIKKIMNEIIENGHGQKMYNEYTNFIDKFGARPSGTENLEKAIDYMVNLTVTNGLSDVITEEIDAPHWVRGHESAKILEPHNRSIAILGLGSSVKTPMEGVTAEAIIIRSFNDLENAEKDVFKGKIVVFDEKFTRYEDSVVYRLQAAVNAARKGAVAALVRSITPFSIYSLHTGMQSYDKNVSKIPSAAISLEDADFLRRLQDKGEKIVLQIKIENSFDMAKSRNTVIDLKGKELPDKFVVVSGHIDSWDVGTGAMDDGGGMMISWFVPVLLNKLNLQPKRTVRAILWTSEEPGLVGAQAYLDRHFKELDKINFIMESDEGTFKPLGLDVAGTNNALCIVKEILKLFSPIDKMTNSGSPGSDITLIVAKGVPGASLLNKNERYFWFHHTDGDTMNVQNSSDVIECAAFWAALSYVIADLSVNIPRI